jgi:phosphoglycolate phosphatase
MPAWKLPVVSRGFIALMKDSADQVKVFDGVPAAIDALAAAGVRLAVVSSNSEQNVRRILGAELAARFERFECGMSVLGKASKLRQVMRQAGVAPDQSIYVGDHGADAQAAHRAGAAFGAVSWGYCPIASLREHGAQMLFARPSDLAAIAGAG